MTGQAEMVVSDHISHLLRLPNNMRGEYAVSVVNSDISPDIRREVLMAAWMHDYVEIWRAAGSSAAFNRLWRRAGFSVGHLDHSQSGAAAAKSTGPMSPSALAGRSIATLLAGSP